MNSDKVIESAHKAAEASSDGTLMLLVAVFILAIFVGHLMIFDFGWGL